MLFKGYQKVQGVKIKEKRRRRGTKEKEGGD